MYKVVTNWMRSREKFERFFTYSGKNKAQEADEHVGIRSGPVLDDAHFFDTKIALGPCEIGKKSMHLIVSVQISGHELSESQRKGYGRNEKRHDSRIEKSAVEKNEKCHSEAIDRGFSGTKNWGYQLFLKEAVHAFVLPHENDVLAMKPNVESSEQTAANADESEGKEFLRVEREVHRKVGHEHRGDRFLSLKPNGQQSKHRCATYRGEKTSPVISHGKVNGGYFDAEQNATDWCSETRCHSNRTRRCQHLAISALVLVNPLEARYQFRKKRRHDTRYMNERTFLSKWQTRSQGRCQPHHFRYQRPKRQIFFQRDPA